MKPVEESVVTAMDGTDKEIFSYLPYILQDAWEIGTDPETIIGLVKKHTMEHNRLRVLDLGCGKGPVSVKLAKELNCTCVGIDAVREFVDEACKRAAEFGVSSLCEFKVEDIRESVKRLSRFDIIVLGAIGPILGDYYSTLTTLSKLLTKNGLIIIDDGYIEDNSDFSHPLMQRKETILSQIKDSGMYLLDEVVAQNDQIKEADEYIFSNLKTRCNELIEKYPGKKNLFEDYIKKQEEENEILENRVVCSTMVIKRLPDGEDDHC